MSKKKKELTCGVCKKMKGHMNWSGSISWFCYKDGYYGKEVDISQDTCDLHTEIPPASWGVRVLDSLFEFIIKLRS